MHCRPAATRDELQHLPREQRQHAAANMALQIAAMLGLEEESDDDTDDFQPHSSGAVVNAQN